MSQNQKILVTGGAGFIGSHLITELLKRNYSVTALDNLYSGKLENLRQADKNPNFTFVKADIRNKTSLKEAFAQADAVVHLAALIDITASVVDPAQTNEVNVTGTLNVLQTAETCKIKKLVFASSTAVYGDTQTLPINEDIPVNPISPYAASKAAGEAYCQAYAKCYGLDIAILRFFNVYGPRNENSPYSGVITKFLKQALNNQGLTVFGDGEQSRDFIHVNDIVEALIHALESKKTDGEIFNICTGKPTTINHLIQTIRAVTGKELQVTYAPARPGEIKFSYGNPNKASKRLKFNAKVNLAEGLNQIIQSPTQ